MSATDGLLTSRLRAELQEARDRAVFSAAAVAVAVGGSTIVLDALGDLAAVDDAGRAIPEPEREPASTETLFDLASVTKVFSAHTLLRLVERGALALDEPVATWLPGYRSGAKREVTLRHLLTHTSGLPAEWRGWHAPLEEFLARRGADAPVLTDTPLDDREGLLAQLESAPLTAPPGTRWEYACTGFNTAMLLAERATGRRWEDLVLEETLRPLRLTGVTARPDRGATAATEYQPEFGRGTIRGIVHDKFAWSLGGGAANAGLFGSARDVLAFAEAIRLGRTGPMREAMWEDQLPSVLPDAGGRPSFGASLGLRIGEADWMGPAGVEARGHTGFTGTSFETDRAGEWSIVLLTNRVHPTRAGEALHTLRGRVAEIVQDHLTQVG